MIVCSLVYVNVKFLVFSECGNCGCEIEHHNKDKYYYTFEELFEYVEDSFHLNQKKAEYNENKNKEKE